MIKIFVDGSSRGNPGPGGSGVIVYDSIKKEILFSLERQYEHITNNRAELNALLGALKLTSARYPDEFCVIYSDSAYVVNMCNSWIYNWARNGWINSRKQQVENYDVVRSIYKYLEKEERNFRIEKIPGHSGELGNELADALAANNEYKFNKLIKENEIKMPEDSIYNMLPFYFEE